MVFESLRLPEIIVGRPRMFGDSRGHFYEMWRAAGHDEAGIVGPFVQDNISMSARSVLRGLHFQHPNGQGKLVTVLRGRIFDVAVDVRRDSATFGQWASVELDGEAGEQIFIPPGFAHGFAVISDGATLSYKCSDYYSPSNERTIRWDDPALGIPWPLANPLLSDKDAGASRLRDLDPEELPIMMKRAG